MIIQFVHLENSIEIKKDKIITLEINNKSLFTSICESIISDKREEAIESYRVYDNENESNVNFVVLNSLPKVPLNSKKLLEKAYKEFAKNVELDEDTSVEINSIAHDLINKIKEVSLKQYCTYDFDQEWDLRSFLKICKYQVEIGHCESLLDKLKEYIRFLADICFVDVLVFVNLKLFLNNNELEDLFEALIFYNIKAILLENMYDDNLIEHEIKYRCDLDLCEFIYS